MGYRFQFITLAGWPRGLRPVFELAQAYAREGMTAYVRLQEREFELEEAGATPPRGTSARSAPATSTRSPRSSPAGRARPSPSRAPPRRTSSTEPGREGTEDEHKARRSRSRSRRRSCRARSPGTVLRQEQISAQYDVSRTPVREALRRLAALGLVSFAPNKSVRVRTLSREELREAFLVRAELEALATELAAPRMSAEDYEALEQAEQRFEELTRRASATPAAGRA